MRAYNIGDALNITHALKAGNRDDKTRRNVLVGWLIALGVIVVGTLVLGLLVS